jgi:hypothetical protein
MRQNIIRVQDVSNLIIENASVISLNFNMRPNGHASRGAGGFSQPV